MTEGLAPDDVLRVAALARIDLDPAEAALLARDCGAILARLAGLREVDVEGVEPWVHAVATPAALRKDEPAQGLAPDDALAGAPDRQGGWFRVPRVLPEAR